MKMIIKITFQTYEEAREVEFLKAIKLIEDEKTKTNSNN